LDLTNGVYAFLNFFPYYCNVLIHLG
jgi:hypothetical protein